MARRTFLLTSVCGAAIAGLSYGAFQSLGGADSITQDSGGIEPGQLANLIGMLLGSGSALGGLLKLWMQDAPATTPLNSLRERLSSGRPMSGDYLAAVAALQGLRRYFRQTPEATVPLEQLASLAWQVDSQADGPSH